jgi:hypothetical protein
MPTDETIPIDAYKKYIEECVETGKHEPSRIIYNRSPIHASILICYLIASANIEICILSGALNHGIYGHIDVLSAITQFLKREGKLRILLDLCPATHDAPDDFHELRRRNPFLNAIHDFEFTEQASVVRVPSQLAKQYPFHCLIADTASFRFEQDRDKLDAIAQFGNESFARSLKARFDEIWLLSRQQRWSRTA